MFSRRDLLRLGAVTGAGLTLPRRAWPAAPVDAEVVAFHRSCIVVDLHVDTFLWVRLFGYDLGQRHHNRLPFTPFAWHADLPRLAEGGVGAVGFGIVVNPRTVRPELMLPLKMLAWYERESGIDAVLHTLDLMHETAQRYPQQLAIVSTATDIRAAHAAGKVSGLPCLEGTHGIEGSLDNVHKAQAHGLRSIGLVHFQATEAAYPMTVAEFEGKGLTDFGRELIGEMERIKLLVDLAHVNDAGFADALVAMKRPFMVSHTGCRAVHAHRRNLTDEQIRAVADRGGVIGMVFEASFIADHADLERVLDHFDHAVKVGGEDVVAIGSDWDGFIIPVDGLEDVTTLPVLTAGLLKRGHRPETVRKILGENALRVFADVFD